MMMSTTKWLILLAVILTLLWRFCTQFRFLVKITAYYLCIGVGSFVCVVRAIGNPGDPENMRKYFEVLYWLSQWLNIRWEVRGAEHLKSDHPAVIVANHQSTIDFQGMGFVWPSRCVVVVKKSFQYIPGVNLAAWLASAVIIDRFNTEKAKVTLKGTVDEIRRKNLKVWIFPEGTRFHHEGMLPFKKGGFHVAVQAQIPIVPVVFSCFLPFYSKNEWRLEDVLPPISTEGLTSDDVDALLERTKAQMLEKYYEISAEAKLRYANRQF